MKKIDVFSYFIAFVLILGLAFLTIKGCREQNSIDNNIAYTKAQIMEIYKVRFSTYCSYQFMIDSTLYKGDAAYYGKFGLVGDSIVIVYDKTNPSNNKSETSFEDYSIFKILLLYLFMIILSWWGLKDL
jgi:hypothetical protein